METSSRREAPAPVKDYTPELDRIRAAIAEALEVLKTVRAGKFSVERKAGGDYVTAADHAINDTLRRLLPRDGEGWLSEETADDLVRLESRRVWVVDPLDGTQEFVQELPEWCISVGLVEDGRPVAGGLCNPATDQLFLGAVGGLVTLNGEPARVRDLHSLDGTEIWASRSEVRRGEWDEPGAPYKVRPCGSVAYKMALVAAGVADATWTLTPKHEWDVAAGAALVQAAGGIVRTLNWEPPTFNNRKPWLSGFIAIPPGLEQPLRRWLEARPVPAKRSASEKSV
jgi:myo-inositol-1(or 4)-monophosphatase